MERITYMKYRRNLGIYGENFASRILIEKGYDILERNYSCRYGEIDIIAKKGSTIHFFEVKTRFGDSCGYPAEAVDDDKLKKMVITAEDYLRKHRPAWRDVSFNVFEIATDILWDVV